MKNVKTPFELRKGVGTAISIGFGAAMGLIINLIGENIGEYRGIEETNEIWRSSVDEVLKQEQEQAKNKTEEEEKEK